MSLVWDHCCCGSKAAHLDTAGVAAIRVVGRIGFVSGDTGFHAFARIRQVTTCYNICSNAVQ